MTAESRRDVLRIGNFSGFYGDRFEALSEMLATDDLDILTGDYLAELTMLLLARDRSKDSALGYARTFLRQLENTLGTALEKGVRIVTNAGGLNPTGLAEAVSTLADRLGLTVRIGQVTGDDVRDRFPGALAANAYLGAWGVAECLRSGADLVITGRITDASLVVGPAAAYFGWERQDFHALAGAMVAGHVIECGPQATGGNYAFFTELPDLTRPGFPVAEVYADGRAVITKPSGTGGAVTRGTVTAQLLYEIGSARYPGPDATARFDTIQLSDDGPDRVRISGVRGEPPPPDHKVGLNSVDGFRNEMQFVLTGLDIEAKAALVQRQLDRPDAQWHLERTDRPDADTEAGASAVLRCVVRGPDSDRVGRAFSDAAVQLALSSYPGCHLVAPPGPAHPSGVFRAASLPQTEVSHRAIRPDGTGVDIPPPPRTQPLTDPVAEMATAHQAAGRTRRVPLGRVIGARSGDKGGAANLGVWVRLPEHYPWLVSALTVDCLRTLLPETRQLPIERHLLPNLSAINFVLPDLLGLGVAWNARFDPQAKALGEWLRSRYLDVPEEVLR